MLISLLLKPFFLPGLLLALTALILYGLRFWQKDDDRRMPPATGRSLLLALPLALAGAGGLYLGVNVFREYGWMLFLVSPCVLGIAASLILAFRGPRTFGECASLSVQTMVLTSLLLLGFGLEGAICVVMALPLVLPFALLGASIGHWIQQGFWSRRGAPALLALLLLSAPLLMGAESVLDREPPTFAVTTTIEVDAPPVVVWRHVIAFPALPPPRELLFRLGIAYPLGAEIRGRGPGAVRYCRFSTGPFVEPVTVWDEPRLLRFGVAANPPSMRELSPYHGLHPPHVEGFLVARQGQFRLVSLPGGRTRVEGTTWYRHGLWPAAYWRLWSDPILHAIHRRVLMHVKALAEAEARAGEGA